MNLCFCCCHHSLCTDLRFIWVLGFGEGRGHWWNSLGVGSGFWGVLSSSPLSSHLPVWGYFVLNTQIRNSFPPAPIIWHLLCGFVLGCRRIEIQNKVLAFRKLQSIKRVGQIAQVQWRTAVEGCESPVTRERSDNEQWLGWKMGIVPSINLELGGLRSAFPYFMSFNLWMVWQQGRVMLGLWQIFVFFWNILFWDNYTSLCSWKKQ